MWSSVEIQPAVPAVVDLSSGWTTRTIGWAEPATDPFGAGVRASGTLGFCARLPQPCGEAQYFAGCVQGMGVLRRSRRR